MYATLFNLSSSAQHDLVRQSQCQFELPLIFDILLGAHPFRRRAGFGVAARTARTRSSSADAGS